jgi:Uma2 family endonuclease
MARKVEECFQAGAEQVWQLFPEARQVRLFRSATASELLTVETDLDGGDLLPGFRCTVGELFELE